MFSLRRRRLWRLRLDRDAGFQDRVAFESPLDDDGDGARLGRVNRRDGAPHRFGIQLDGQGLVGFLHLIATYAQPLHAAGAALAAAVTYAVMRLAYPPAR
jgi:hypothetical protein